MISRIENTVKENLEWILNNEYPKRSKNGSDCFVVQTTRSKYSTWFNVRKYPHFQFIYGLPDLIKFIEKENGNKNISFKQGIYKKEYNEEKQKYWFPRTDHITRIKSFVVDLDHYRTIDPARTAQYLIDILAKEKQHYIDNNDTENKDTPFFLIDGLSSVRFTGGGFQFVFRLSEHITNVDLANNILDFLILQMIKRYGSVKEGGHVDTSNTADQCQRLPGTLNIKYRKGKGIQSQLLFVNEYIDTEKFEQYLAGALERGNALTEERKQQIFDTVVNSPEIIINGKSEKLTSKNKNLIEAVNKIDMLKIISLTGSVPEIVSTNEKIISLKNPSSVGLQSNENLLIYTNKKYNKNKDSKYKADKYRQNILFDPVKSTWYDNIKIVSEKTNKTTKQAISFVLTKLKKYNILYTAKHKFNNANEERLAKHYAYTLTLLSKQGIHLTRDQYFKAIESGLDFYDLFSSYRNVDQDKLLLIFKNIDNLSVKEIRDQLVDCGLDLVSGYDDKEIKTLVFIIKFQNFVLRHMYENLHIYEKEEETKPKRSRFSLLHEQLVA